MRIGLIIYGSLDTLSGGYLYDRIVAQGLRRRGHAVEVISLPGGSYLQRLGQGLAPQLCRRLLAGRFDILIQDELCHPSLFLVNRRLRRHKGPVLIALVHHVLCDEPRAHLPNALLAVAERRYLASVDGLILNSQTTRQKVAALVRHTLPQVVASPAGDRLGSPPSSEEIGKRAFQPGPLELLFLGNVIPRKGLLPLLRALAAVDRSLWRLSVAGSLDFDPAYTSRVRQLVDHLGLSDSVRFMGPLHDTELVEILSTSHLFCMPYAYEGFGIAMLEAMAFGLPAIGCRSGAACETISHGVNGFLLDPGDLAELRPLLEHLHRNREGLLQLSLAARATYAASPSWQDGVAAIDGFLQQMQRGRRKSSTGDTDAAG